MPDLGKYAETVISAYAVSMIALAALVIISLVQSEMTKKKLQDIEKKAKKDG